MGEIAIACNKRTYNGNGAEKDIAQHGDGQEYNGAYLTQHKSFLEGL